MLDAFKSQIRGLPEKNWKASLAFGVEVRQTKAPKPIPKISKKKKERLKSEGSETSFFMEIWNSRPHLCEIYEDGISTPKPECFSHGAYQGYSLNRQQATLS